MSGSWWVRRSWVLWGMRGVIAAPCSYRWFWCWRRSCMPARSDRSPPDTVAGMSGRTQLMWDDAVTGYDFGETHPMDPVRLALTMGLVRACGLDGAVDLRSAKSVGDSTLRLVHRQDYVAA